MGIFGAILGDLAVGAAVSKWPEGIKKAYDAVGSGARKGLYYGTLGLSYVSHIIGGYGLYGNYIDTDTAETSLGSQIFMPYQARDMMSLDLIGEGIDLAYSGRLKRRAERLDPTMKHLEATRTGDMESIERRRDPARRHAVFPPQYEGIIAGLNDDRTALLEDLTRRRTLPITHRDYIDVPTLIAGRRTVNDTHRAEVEDVMREMRGELPAPHDVDLRVPYRTARRDVQRTHRLGVKNAEVDEPYPFGYRPLKTMVEVPYTLLLAETGLKTVGHGLEIITGSPTSDMNETVFRLTALAGAAAGTYLAFFSGLSSRNSTREAQVYRLRDDYNTEWGWNRNAVMTSVQDLVANFNLRRAMELAGYGAIGIGIWYGMDKFFESWSPSEALETMITARPVWLGVATAAASPLGDRGRIEDAVDAYRRGGGMMNIWRNYRANRRARP